VSGDANNVAIYSLTDMTHEGILSRASAPVTCMSISSDGKLLASGGWYMPYFECEFPDDTEVFLSSDFVVHVTDTKSHKDSQITAHTAPILSVAFDPKGEFLVRNLTL
jgi:WD40 repeat protein